MHPTISFYSNITKSSSAIYIWTPHKKFFSCYHNTLCLLKVKKKRLWMRSNIFLIFSMHLQWYSLLFFKQSHGPVGWQDRIGGIQPHALGVRFNSIGVVPSFEVLVSLMKEKGARFIDCVYPWTKKHMMGGNSFKSVLFFPHLTENLH